MRRVVGLPALVLLTAWLGCAAPPRTPSEIAARSERSTSAAGAGTPQPLSLTGHEASKAAIMPPADGLLPAGPCGFNAYLSPPCDDALLPRFAVVVDEFAVGPLGAPRPRAARALLGDAPLRPDQELRAAENVLSRSRAAGLPPGYPFVVSYDDMPAADDRRAIAIVAGLFIEREQAQRYIESRKLRASIVELGGAAEASCGGDDYEACLKTTRTVIEIPAGAPAFAQRDLEAMEKRTSALHGEALEVELQRSLATMKPVCTLEPGHLSITNRSELYTFQRSFAPVQCVDGKRGFVAWRATRLESVVVIEPDGPFIHQVVAVSCDSPTLERRPFGSAPSEPALVAAVGCRG